MEVDIMNIMYCKECGITGKNVDKYREIGFTEKALSCMKGFIGVYDEEIKTELKYCPFCGSTLIDTLLPIGDCLSILSWSNYDRESLESMIRLKNEDVVGYQLKLNALKTQLSQEQNTYPNHISQVTCPYCHSTNVKKITATSKAGSVALWGIFSQNVRKNFHCNNCKSDF